MRRKSTFRPTDLDGLESRVALSAVGAVSAEVAKIDHRDHTTGTDHTPRTDHHHDGHELRHEHHGDVMKK